jgi:hypothetical protein
MILSSQMMLDNGLIMFIVSHNWLRDLDIRDELLKVIIKNIKTKDLIMKQFSIFEINSAHETSEKSNFSSFIFWSDGKTIITNDRFRSDHFSIDLFKGEVLSHKLYWESEGITMSSKNDAILEYLSSLNNPSEPPKENKSNVLLKKLKIFIKTIVKINKTVCDSRISKEVRLNFKNIVNKVIICGRRYKKLPFVKRDFFKLHITPYYRKKFSQNKELSKFVDAKIDSEYKVDESWNLLNKNYSNVTSQNTINGELLTKVVNLPADGNNRVVLITNSYQVLMKERYIKDLHLKLVPVPKSDLEKEHNGVHKLVVATIINATKLSNDILKHNLFYIFNNRTFILFHEIEENNFFEVNVQSLRLLKRDEMIKAYSKLGFVKRTKRTIKTKGWLWWRFVKNFDEVKITTLFSNNVHKCHSEDLKNHFWVKIYSSNNQANKYRGIFKTETRVVLNPFWSYTPISKYTGFHYNFSNDKNITFDQSNYTSKAKYNYNDYLSQSDRLMINN